MARICQVSGRTVQFGNNVSHANNKTRRVFRPNVHKHRFFVPSEGRYISLKVSHKALRTIHKKGIESILSDLRQKGMKI